MSPTQTRFGVAGAGWPSKRLGGSAHGRVRVSGAGHKRAGLLRPQAVGMERAANAPAADRMAVGLHFHPQPARTIALAVVAKGFAHGHLPGRLDRWRCQA